MTVRLATDADLPRCMKWARDFFAYHPLSKHIEMDEGQVLTVLRNLMTHDDGVIFLHDHGVIGGLINGIWLNPEAKQAIEMFWWAERDGLSLLQAFENWAKEKGAQSVQMLAIDGVRDVTPIYKRRGYVPIEKLYGKRL